MYSPTWLDGGGGGGGQGCRCVRGHVQSCMVDGVCWGDMVAGV